MKWKILVFSAGLIYRISKKEELKKELSKLSWESKIIEIVIYYIFFREKKAKELVKEIIWMIFIKPSIIIIKLLLADIKKTIIEVMKSKNDFYKKYLEDDDLSKEQTKKLIFARANLCSSSLLQWAYRKEFVNEEKTKQIWGLLHNNPNSLDTYYVKNLDSGSINYLTEKRKKATSKQLKEILKLARNTEKFIKKGLEKGTKFEGEFDKKFPRTIKSEEEKWEEYEIEQKIKREELEENY